MENYYKLTKVGESISIVDKWLSKTDAKKLASWWNCHDKKHYYFVKPIKILLPFRRVTRFDVIKTLVSLNN